MMFKEGGKALGRQTRVLRNYGGSLLVTEGGKEGLPLLKRGRQTRCSKRKSGRGVHSGERGGQGHEKWESPLAGGQGEGFVATKEKKQVTTWYSQGKRGQRYDAGYTGRVDASDTAFG